MASNARANADTASYRVPALEKGLDVLELVAGSAEPLTLTAMAQRLGRTKQELFRVVVRLADRGYLLRDQSGSYRLSAKLFELGSRQASIHALVERAMPHMQRLALEIGESCHLNIVVQNRMLVVARADSDADIALAVRVGAGFRLHERNTGQVALAYLPPERRDRYWHDNGQSPQRIKRWERELAAVRRRGYLHAESPITRGVRDCAVAILAGSGQLLAVLCVSQVIRLARLASCPGLPRAVVGCARAISQEFGPLEAQPLAGVPAASRRRNRPETARGP
ncbi:MAG TPA: IclR family transcriptional regulator [Pirellulales bacterium]|jgi:DNA-binding IclR family transcriptional regulator|nr:IclR family transcriptional regulator [Pirellulales bacterium]